MRAVTTPVAAPIMEEPLKTPNDLKKAEASNMCVCSTGLVSYNRPEKHNEKQQLRHAAVPFIF